MATDLPKPIASFRMVTRGLPLDLAQAHETRTCLTAEHNLPEKALEILVIKTTGDRVQDCPLKEIDGKGCLAVKSETRFCLVASI